MTEAENHKTKAKTHTHKKKNEYLCTQNNKISNKKRQQNLKRKGKRKTR